MKFEKARDLFQKIRNDLMGERYRDNIHEFLIALKKLIFEYNTANWENRFVVGGALEILFCSLLKSIGYDCKWLNEARYDLLINGIKFSIKSNFTGKGDIRLINILGNKMVQWSEPTLFFISNIGICYADPHMKLETRHTRDARLIKVNQIQKLTEIHPTYVIPLEIPEKPKITSKIKTASYDVAKSILDEIKSKHLKNNLPKY